MIANTIPIAVIIIEIAATISAIVAILLALWASALARRASYSCSALEASLRRSSQARANAVWPPK
jgi:hypothetical protein